MKKTLSGVTVIMLAMVMVFTSAFAVFAEPEITETDGVQTEGYESADAQCDEMQVPAEGQESDELQPVEAGDTQAETYTVIWMNHDGTGEPLETDENVEAGTQPHYDGAVPAKASDGKYDYSFEGWAEEAGQETGLQADQLAEVTGDVTYYAAFSKKEIPHVHSFGGWTTTANPTYFKSGTRVRKCSCGVTETQSIPKLTARKKWISDGGKRYYFGENGTPVKGWVKMKPYKSKTVKWCYFSQSGAYVKSIKKNTRNKWVKAGGYKFYFTKKKKPAGYGFHFIGSKLYHMNSFGAVMYGTFKASDGKTYTTTKSGTISGTEYYKKKYKTFVLVDISEQTIWYYRNGEQKLKSDVVTGTKGRTPTPTGVFKVRSKLRNINLVGPTWSSHVHYWMAFKGSSYGLHDANWRSSGQFSNHRTYLRSGSHGCINLRPSFAPKLFRMVSIGTPVIVIK